MLRRGRVSAGHCFAGDIRFLVAHGAGRVMTYAIPRYPVHLIDVVRLSGGSRVTIRPTLPQDVELQREFFRRLSATGAIAAS